MKLSTNTQEDLCLVIFENKQLNIHTFAFTFKI